jgi:hypothetical protein
MDFIEKLPESYGFRNLMVITDRLGKGVILIPLITITAEDVAWVFIREVYRHHGIPSAIVSDRGSAFVGQVWRRICTLLKIEQRLSTGYHPQTDGATERANSTIESIFRTYVSHDQTDWARLCPIVELMINSRTSQTTKLSPFFLAHGYHPSPFPDDIPSDIRTNEDSGSPIARGEAIVAKIRSSIEWAQASMTYAQQLQEQQANRTRHSAPQYRVGDKVWLDIRNIQAVREQLQPETKILRKFAPKYNKFTVTQVISAQNVQLNVPWREKTFHVDLLRPAASDPFPTQISDDTQPPPLIIHDALDGKEGHEEYEVDCIVGEYRHARTKKITHYSVIWKGYAGRFKEPQANLEDSIALDKWIHYTAHVRDKQGILFRNWSSILTRTT